MLGQFIVVMLAFALWPLIVQSLILTMLVLSLLWHVPGIWATYRWSTWLWPALGLVLVLEAVGTYLVMQAPYSGWPSTLAPQPTTAAALVLSAWTLLGWVLATELTARFARQRQEKGENLESFLHQPF